DKIEQFLDSDLVTEPHEDLEDKKNVKVFGTYDMKGYNMLTRKTPIKTPDDLKGLKIRTSPIDLQIDLLNELGASATPLDYSESFTSLQQGTLDGIHTATALAWTDKFHEVTDYL